MFLKKIKSFQRSPIQWTIHFLVPPIFLLLILIISGGPILSELPPLVLSLSSYKESVTLLENHGDYGGYYDSYKDLILAEKFDVHDANIEKESLQMTKKKPHTFYGRYIIGASFKSKGNTPIIGAWFNNHVLHSQPLALSYAQNAIFRKISSCQDCSFQITNEPFPFSDKTLVSQLEEKSR
nr:unnamed protein product [Callosobruchus analis]